MAHSMMVIHGGNGSPAGLAPLAAQFQPYGQVWTPTMLGHGGRALPQALSVQTMAADLIAQMDEHGMGPCFVGGYSFGAYLALYLAKHHPQRFHGVWTLAAKVVYDAQALSHLVHLTSPSRVERGDHPFADDIRQRHQPQDWRAVMLLNQALFRSLQGVSLLGDEVWPARSMPALVISGDADPLVSADETKQLAIDLQCPLMMFPGPAHPIAAVPMAAMASEVNRWMDWVMARKVPSPS